MQVTPKWSMSHPQPLPCSLKLGHCSLTAQQLLSSYTVPFSVKSQVGLWNTQKARTGSCSCPGAISAGGVPSPKAPPNHEAACPLHPACGRRPKGPISWDAAHHCSESWSQRGSSRASEQAPEAALLQEVVHVQRVGARCLKEALAGS